MKIGDLAKKTNATMRTVRYYEEVGLLKPSGRTKGGMRFYEEDDLKKLRTIQMLKEMNMSIVEISDLLNARKKYRTGGEAAKTILNNLDGKMVKLSEAINKLNEIKKEIEISKQFINDCIKCNNEIDKSQCINCNFTEEKRNESILYASLYI